MYLQNPDMLLTEYVLPLSFGLVVMPEEIPFSHMVQLQASLQDVGEIASLLYSGLICNMQLPHLKLFFFSAALHFRCLWWQQFLPQCEIWQSRQQFPDMDWSPTLDTWGGRRLQLPGKWHPLQPHCAIQRQGYGIRGMPEVWLEQYAVKELYYLLQVITSNSIRARVDLLLYDPVNNWALADLFLACSFPLMTTSMLKYICRYLLPLTRWLFQSATLMERWLLWLWKWNHCATSCQVPWPWRTHHANQTSVTTALRISPSVLTPVVPQEL